MKKALMVILIIVVAIAVLVAAVFYLTSGITRSANQFFTLVRSGNIQAAYASTAQEFRAATSESQFADFLKDSLVADYESSTWTSRSVRNNTGELEGSLKTKSGGVIPIKIIFVKETGSWKVLSIKKPQAGVSPQSPAFPTEAELIAMTDHSILMLGRAINTADFQSFYSECSNVWQKQTTPDALKEVFKSFLDQKIDLTMARGIKPEFGEKPAIDSNGVLIVKGLYPVQQSRLNFTFKYIQETGLWKLVGTKVSVTDAPNSSKAVMPEKANYP